MKRLPPALFVVGSALILVSLDLDWRPDWQVSVGVRGWWLNGSSAAAIASAALFALGVGTLAHPRLAERLPVGRVALVVGYLALCLLISAHDMHMRELPAPFPKQSSGYRVGVVVAALGTCLVLLGTGVLRFREVIRGWSWRGAGIVLLAAGVCVGLALPWWRGGSQSYGLFRTDWAPAVTPGVNLMSGTIAAVGAISIATGWWRKDPGAPASRLALSAGLVVFVGGAYAIARQGSPRYGVWVTLAFAVALLAATMILALPLTRPVRPPWRSLGVAVSASALLASMFLPWVRDSTGWSLFTCVLAAALAAFAVRQAVAPRSTTVPLVEVATGCVLLVLVTWFSAAEYFTLVDWRSLRVGAWIGFASAVLLLVFSLSGLRLRLDRSFPVPVLLALVYLFVNVLCTALGLVTLLPGSVRSRFLKLIGRYFVPTTWMSLVGLVVSILLVGAWLRRSDLEGSARRITLAMALLGLALLDIFSTAANSSFEFALSVNGGGVRTATYAGTALALVALGALDHVRNKASIATPGAVELEPS